MPGEVPGEKEALDLSQEMLLVEGVETNEELLLARDLTTSFVKTIKAFRFYPPDNPSLKGFQDQLLKKFQFFLSNYQSFAIQIGEYYLSYKGKPFYENKDVKTSLAFLFYKDGLRELRFKNGLEEWEINGLIDIIRQGDHINQLEDDLVTLIWERDFLHISHLATDEFLEEMPVEVPENIDQFRKNLVLKPFGHYVEVDLLEEGDKKGLDLDELLSKVIEEPLSFVSDKRVYSLTPDEAEGLRREVESEVAPSFVFNIIDTLFEILDVEKEPEPFQDTVDFLNKMLDALLTLGEFQKASDLLKRVDTLLKTSELKSWQIEIFKKFMMEAGEEQRINRIGRMLERGEKVQLEDLIEYLLLLEQNSIEPLVKLLGELRNSKARRMICDALSEIGKKNIDVFTPFMDDRRWFLVRNITYILGRMGVEQTLPYIQKAFNHMDVRVRREAVQSLGSISGPKASSLLVEALIDEDARIRSLAAINLGRVGKKAGLVYLLEVIQSKDFYKREPAEIKAFFDAIGMVGSNEPIPVLQELLERKSWFGGSKLDQIRFGAANALAMIGTREAKAILESGKGSKDESIRSACLQALRGQFPQKAGREKDDITSKG